MTLTTKEGLFVSGTIKAKPITLTSLINEAVNAIEPRVVVNMPHITVASVYINNRYAFSMVNNNL